MGWILEACARGETHRAPFRLLLVPFPLNLCHGTKDKRPASVSLRGVCSWEGNADKARGPLIA
jgi:hypothetical protein